jgi:membrane-associated phospholipid phosphatase
MQPFLTAALRAALLLLCLHQSLPAQDASPYHFSIKQDVLAVGGGLLGITGAELLRKSIRPVSIQDLPGPDLGDFDDIQFIYGDKWADHLSNKTMFATAGLSAILLADRRCRSEAGKIGLLYLETMLVNQAVTNFSKAAFRRPRPYVFAPGWAANRKVLSGDRSSMISGHTSGAAAGAFFFARVFSDYHPDSKLKPYIWGFAATLPLVTGYLRVRAAKHYPTDVFAGYLIGAATGYLVPLLHTSPLANRRFSVQAGGDGVGLRILLD